MDTSFLTKSAGAERPGWAVTLITRLPGEPDEMTDDIVRDLHEVIVSMCARLYGKRSANNRAKKALEAITKCADE